MYVDQFEVTNAQFGEFLRDAGEAVRRLPRVDWAVDPSTGYETEVDAVHSRGQAFGEIAVETWARMPVVNVTWLEASAYAEWVGAALPSEDEFKFILCPSAGARYPWVEGASVGLCPRPPPRWL